MDVWLWASKKKKESNNVLENQMKKMQTFIDRCDPLYWFYRRHTHWHWSASRHIATWKPPSSFNVTWNHTKLAFYQRWFITMNYIKWNYIIYITHGSLDIKGLSSYLIMISLSAPWLLNFNRTLLIFFSSWNRDLYHLLPNNTNCMVPMSL